MTDLDPDGEALTLRNTGGTVLDLDGYAIDFDGLAQVYVLPNHTLDPGESVRVRTGRGNDTGSVLYAGFFEPVIHGGDTIVVETSDREIVDGRRLDG